MRSQLPPKPTGSTPEASFMQWVWDSIINRFRFNDSSTVKFDVTTRGVTAHVKPSKGGSGTTFSLFRVQSETVDSLICRTLTNNASTGGLWAEGGTDVKVFKPDGLVNIARNVTYLGMTINYSPLRLNVGGVQATSPNKRFSHWTNGINPALAVNYKEVIWPPYIDTFPITLGPDVNNMIWAFKRFDGAWVDANMPESTSGIRQWMKEVVVCVKDS